MKRKIHCIEAQDDNKLDKMTFSQVKKMVGYYFPEDIEEEVHTKDHKGKHVRLPNKKMQKWVVTLMDGGHYFADTQFEAHVIASLEEIKAMMLPVVKEEKQ